MIICISGYAGAGKDTVADFFVDAGFVKVGLADPLKRFCQDVFRFSQEQLWGSSEKRNEPDPRYPRGDGSFLTARRALQLLGTEFGRACYEDLWLEYAWRVSNDIMGGAFYSKEGGVSWRKERHQGVLGIVIPDVRFKNEALFFKKKTGTRLLYVEREGVGKGTHASEVEQEVVKDLADNVIMNDSTLRDLKIKVVSEELLPVLQKLRKVNP